MKIQASRISLLLAFAIAAASCAKTVSEGTNVAEKRYFDAYMQTHYPDVGKIGHGVYILDATTTSGEEMVDSNYIFVHYICRSVPDGSIVGYTDSYTAKKMGEYSETDDYSPYIFQYIKGVASQGLIDMFTGGTDPVSGKTYGKMRTGESRRAIIPGWLSSASYYYDTEKEYLNNVTGTDYMYEFTFLGQTDDIIKWQIDSIERVLARKGWDVDSLPGHYGLYYYRDRAREEKRGVVVKDTVAMPEDTVVYINYIGRLLSGKVFDTNIEDTAKVWGIYSSSNTYEPVSITWSSDSTALTMGDDEDSVIEGFSLSLFQMHPYESGHGIFTSAYGYGASGSGSSIPAYAPLIFDIDIVDEEDD